MRVAHVAFELCLGHEGRDRVDDDDIDRIRAYEHLGDVERLLAGIRLGNQQRIEIDAKRPGVLWIEGVFDVDEGRGPAGLLRFGDDVQCEGRLAARFRPVDFHDATARQPADAERQIECYRAR